MDGNVVLAYMILFTYIINIIWIPLYEVLYYILNPQSCDRQHRFEVEDYIVAWVISPITFPLTMFIILGHIFVNVMTCIFKPLQEIVQIILDKMEK